MSKNDTISREYLLAEIDDLADEFSEIDENGLHSERWCGISDAKRVIINTPFVSDRSQGEWRPKNHHTDYCSNCGFEETQWRTADYNFCPSCGARMKGADDEHS